MNKITTKSTFKSWMETINNLIDSLSSKLGVSDNAVSATKAESYFNNLIKINKKHKIYSDDVVSIVLKKIIISHYNVDVREVKTISKDSDWNPYSEDEKTFESNFVAG